MPVRLLPFPRPYWPIVAGAVAALLLGMRMDKAPFAAYVALAKGLNDGHSGWWGITARAPDLGPAALLFLRIAGARAHGDAAITGALVVLGVLAIAGAALLVARALHGRISDARATWWVAAIALNPGLWIVNGLAGPFDIVAAFCVLAATIALARGALATAWFAAFAGFAFTPVPSVFIALLCFAPLLYEGDARAHAWRQTLRGVLVGGLALSLCAAFFAAKFHPIEGAAWLAAHYPDGFTSYHFNSSGAFNLYALFGSMWRPEASAQWGYALFAAVAIAIGVRFIREKKPEHAPLAAFLLLFAVFIFPPRMYPAQLAYAVMLLPLTLALGLRAIAATAVLGLTLSVNALFVAYRTSVPFVEHVLAACNVATFFVVANAFVGTIAPGLNLSARVEETPRAASHDVAPLDLESQGPGATMTPLDYACVCALMIVFLATAYVQFWNPPAKIFDEIYYVRAGAEYLQHREIYESTHPPLTKLLVAASMLVGGDRPFGWRLFNVLAGTLQIGVVYLFARRWLRSRAFAALAAGIVAFDGFHFAQARIATPEITVAFFTILTLYCFYRYWTASSAPGVTSAAAGNVPLRTTVAAMVGGGLGTTIFLHASLGARVAAACYFGVCAYALVARLRAGAPGREPARWFWATALSMGALAACKWNGLFTFAAIVAIFALVHIFRRVRASEAWGGFAGVSADAFVPTLLAVGATIYLISYLPYFSLGHSIDDFLSMQAGMFRYHSTLVATHPYASVWWQWPLIFRPIAYFVHNTSNATTPCCMSIIIALPNPLTWWSGLVSVPYCAFVALTQRNKGAALIVTAYLAQWLPWAFSPRIAFEYHFYPNAALIALANAFLLQRLWMHAPREHKRIAGFGVAAYACCAVAAFMYWYPVVSGLPITMQAYNDRMLLWLVGTHWI